MVKNNIEVDVKVKLLEAGTTQEKLGETIGTTGQYVNRILKKNNEVVNKTQHQLAEAIRTTGQYINRVRKKNGGIVNDTFVKMMDALGYNIVLTYEKKD